MLCDAFADPVEAGDAMPLDLGLVLARLLMSRRSLGRQGTMANIDFIYTLIYLHMIF